MGVEKSVGISFGARCLVVELLAVVLAAPRLVMPLTDEAIKVRSGVPRLLALHRCAFAPPFEFGYHRLDLGRLPVEVPRRLVALQSFASMPKSR